MADFRIHNGRDVWFNGRRYGAGREDALEAAGFGGAEKDEQLRRGTIEMIGNVVAADAAEVVTAPDQEDTNDAYDYDGMEDEEDEEDDSDY